MNGFKRFLSIVFAISGLLALAALIAPWLGPFTQWAQNMMYTSWYFIALQVLALITLVGLLFILIRALVVRDPKNLVINRVDGGQITVSRDAIASQASHIVSADGTCTADRIRVRTKGGNVNVNMRIHPRTSIDVVEKGAQLHEALNAGLAAVCGDHVGRINLDFVQPENITDPIAVATYVPSQDSYSLDPAADTAAASVDSSAIEGTGDITVPMSDYVSSQTDQSSED